MLHYCNTEWHDSCDRDRSPVSSPANISTLLPSPEKARVTGDRTRTAPDAPAHRPRSPRPRHASTPPRAELGQGGTQREGGAHPLRRVPPPSYRPRASGAKPSPGPKSVRNESSRSGTLFRGRALGSRFFAGHWHVEMPTTKQPWSAMTCLDGSRAPTSSSGDERRVS
jgi:hypothetical protein